MLWTTGTIDGFAAARTAAGKESRRPSVCFDEKGTFWCAWEEGSRIRAVNSNSAGSRTVSSENEVGCALPSLASSDKGLVGVTYQIGNRIVFRKLSGN